CVCVFQCWFMLGWGTAYIFFLSLLLSYFLSHSFGLFLSLHHAHTHTHRQTHRHTHTHTLTHPIPLCVSPQPYVISDENTGLSAPISHDHSLHTTSPLSRCSAFLLSSLCLTSSGLV